MSNETLFYIFGIALAVSALAISFAGLKLEKFPGRAAPIVALWFIVLIGCTTTFGVLNSQDESAHREAELEHANEEVEEEEADSLSTGEESGAGKEEAAGGEAAAKGQAEGGGEAKPEGGATTTLKLAADPSAIAFDTTSLSAKAGKVTIDFDNPSPLEHDVAIDEGGKELAKSETISSGETSVSVDLAPGTYTFLCTVPGHAEAGMEGTLTVH
jgi:plastocyanin